MTKTIKSPIKSRLSILCLLFVPLFVLLVLGSFAAMCISSVIFEDGNVVFHLTDKIAQEIIGPIDPYSYSSQGTPTDSDSEIFVHDAHISFPVPIWVVVGTFAITISLLTGIWLWRSRRNKRMY